ncbi:hypothetical protein ABL78_2658 [Leptomonas seymouri]|uniref:Transmembrane protein n=1 Tax=Leptomonas seymouri TaxID=5684 RepID=A0A0N1I5V1_LEPSE|nr:hypothetical protein ABL78_2658 [Leptomonas seymouri]|eukprot:KPI88234.1 hypothetical protein ABL78_2658 [Leptomonas seymouri]
MWRLSSAAGLRPLMRRSCTALSHVGSGRLSCAATSIRRGYHPSTALYAASNSSTGAAEAQHSSAKAETVEMQQSAARSDRAPSQFHRGPGRAESSNTTAESPSATAGRTTSLAVAIAHPESALRRLVTSWQQGVVASIGAVMGIGFLLYFLYTPVKEDTVHHTAVVASEALADARLKGQAVQLSKDVLLEVLRDPRSLDAVADVTAQLLAREETKIAVSSLLQSLFEDHYTQEVTKKFVLQVVQDPWIQDQLQGITEEQVRKLLRNPEIKRKLSDFLLKSAVDSLEKPQFHFVVARAIRQSVASVFNFWWT